MVIGEAKPLLFRPTKFYSKRPFLRNRTAKFLLGEKHGGNIDFPRSMVVGSIDIISVLLSLRDAGRQVELRRQGANRAFRPAAEEGGAELRYTDAHSRVFAHRI